MKMKKILATTLAVSMVMASALTVCATTETPVSGVSAEQQTIEEATVTVDAPVVIGGKVVQNTVKNVVLSETIKAAVISVPKDTVKANLGLKAGQTPKVVIYDFNAKKSPAAAASINAAVNAIGGTAVATLDIDLSAIEKGKKVTLKDGSVAMSIGLPKKADTSKTYVMVCVQAGGVTTVFEDQDTNPKTVTFPVQAGAGTYALVAK